MSQNGQKWAKIMHNAAKNFDWVIILLLGIPYLHHSLMRFTPQTSYIFAFIHYPLHQHNAFHTAILIHFRLDTLATAIFIHFRQGIMYEGRKVWRFGCETHSAEAVVNASTTASALFVSHPNLHTFLPSYIIPCISIMRFTPQSSHISVFIHYPLH